MVFEVLDIGLFKQRALQWANTFEVACYLDSNNFKNKHSKFDTLIAVGACEEVTAPAGQAFDALQQFRQKHTGWITGFFGYDLKNEVEDLSSTNPDHLQFPDLYFFAPLHLLIIRGTQVEVITDEPEAIVAIIEQQVIGQPQFNINIQLQARFNHNEYLTTFENIKQHIARGDIYVTNFCQEFFADDADISPLQLFLLLNQASPNPFACFFKHYRQYILCASPERFLAKRGNQLLSQPIKGTARRGQTAQEDETIKQRLRQNIKEQQENVMVVDLVRNDLTKSAKRGTVQTEELFGIYSFKQVHQMISTITCELDDSITAIEAIKNTFPMGSMTGAPKLKAMQLMEQYERSRRGVYSGAVGYLSPDDDFDFNVVIRSLFYNAANRYLSFQVGSAITYNAVAGQEYDECLLKAQAILQVLGAQIT
ncbi:anthranilate synthase component I family protein [Mucilaginibacter sp. Bleaf8]|uniref:anthranilate synthase component I family protein n=1 Tax=Mucilaginibacter sp. Bleaf8 TaxID=2834430 RepID=UPI001BCFDD2D|nr:anthranilate synthase component I family protein [Mucilaginibacter sp. Bleaf8]MBS7564600.1 anthranilate synthase component I family protein [Mucilaginibacter sp. Bleaf8]